MPACIFIVDDEPAIADAIQYALETEGFATARYPDGRSVLADMARKPDLILLDVGLPDMSGFEVCSAIRRASDVPVIFLTARGHEIDRVVGLEIGGDDYIVKPFSPREVSARVKAVLRRAGTSLPVKTAASGTWIVDEERRRISWLGQALELSRYEYEILKTLVRRPGRVFSREQLMELVWDSPDTSLERTVDAHIKNIRAKLRRIAPERDPIVTHRGSGYALREEA